MLYALIGEDAPGTLDKRMAMRAAHVQRLDQLRGEGRLVLAGPFPAIDSPDPGPAGYSGGMIVAEFASLTAAEAWLADDPFVTAGVFGRTSVKPFRQTQP